MNRPATHAILCLTLCPLLTAQQVSQPGAPLPSQSAPAERYITLPSDSNIELLPPGPTSFAKEKPGVLVQFVLDRDLLLNGKTVIHASVPVAGVIDSVKRASHFKHRPAEMNIRVTEMVAGQPTELHLRCFDPDYDPSGPTYSYDEPHPNFNPFKAALITVGVTVGFLLVIALLSGDR
jgi:hypothetical protein